MRISTIFYLFPALLLASCGGHVAPIVPVNLPRQQIIHTQVPYQVKALRNTLDTRQVSPIYLYIEDNRNDHNLMSNQSGNRAGLPVTFRVLAMSVANEFGSKVEVYTGKTSFERVLSDPVKYGNAFEVEGAITGFDQHNQVISSGINFGLEFGEGSSQTTNNDRYRNTDRVSNLQVDVFFKQDGKIFVASSAEITIRSINRGYDFGLRINGSGFGLNSYNTKADGLGKSLRRILQFVYADLIEKVMKKKDPYFNARPRSAQHYPQQRSKPNQYYQTTKTRQQQSIGRQEEEFLQRLQSY